MNNLNVKYIQPINIDMDYFLELLIAKPKKVNRFAVSKPNNEDHLITFQYLKADGKTPTAFNNMMDNEVSMEWNEFRKIIKPTQYSDKKLLPAIIPASLTSNPVFTVCDNQGVEQPRRCRENINQYYALFLDFDGELQIEDFVKNNTNIEYILYTTSSSTKEVNRFRAIIPLLTPVEFKEIETRKIHIAKYFKLDKDMSTFACSRLFYLPSKDSKIFLNTGDFFDLEKTIQAIIPKPKPVKFFQQSEDSIKRDRDRACGYIDVIRDKHHHKLHHNELIQIVGAMQSEGLDSIIDIVIKEIKAPSSSFNLKQAKRSVKAEHYTGGTLAYYAKGEFSDK
ncbi:MAG: hypothetical protein ACI88H_000683 [Cocleimonas sp.]|jgi:hypothetical protein